IASSAYFLPGSRSNARSQTTAFPCQTNAEADCSTQYAVCHGSARRPVPVSGISTQQAKAGGQHGGLPCVPRRFVNEDGKGLAAQVGLLTGMRSFQSGTKKLSTIIRVGLQESG